MKTIFSTSIGLFLLFTIQCFAIAPQPFSWVYQLQNTSYSQLQNAHYDIAIIDFEASELNTSQIQELQHQGKKIISYLSIGEAEDYRRYWQTEWDINPPNFLDQENPNWEGNYKVQYWSPLWKKIILQQLKSIQNLGYDGVYLDIIDAYEYYENKGKKDARYEMMYFIRQIAQEGRKKNKKFFVITQNAPELLAPKGMFHNKKPNIKDKRMTRRYLSTINGIAKEDTWYNDNKPQKKEDIEYELQFLKYAQKKGKFILNIDYPTNKIKQCDFIKQSLKQNFIPLISDRNLSTFKQNICL
jgi:cysteinyl-tRNA synthetase, unknown class